MEIHPRNFIFRPLTNEILFLTTENTVCIKMFLVALFVITQN